MRYSYRNLKKRVAFEILTGWLVLAPLAIGLTLLIGTWALSFAASGLMAAVGGLLTLVSGAVWLTQFFGNREPVEQRVIAKLKAEEEAEDRARLDELDARLQVDGDPRTENALRDLRQLRRTMHSLDLSADLIAADSIIEGIDELYDDSIKGLEKSLALSKTLRGLSTSEARSAIESQRDKIIGGIQQSIVEIGTVIGDLQVLAVSGDNDSQSELRGRLSEQMETVKTVHQRMQRWQAGDFSEIETDDLNQTVVA
tara:strand:- start:14363 stop:15127 length:765 start_codon:yes stop_codon:yes gene_type:complete